MDAESRDKWQAVELTECCFRDAARNYDTSQMEPNHSNPQSKQSPSPGRQFAFFDCTHCRDDATSSPCQDRKIRGSGGRRGIKRPPLPSLLEDVGTHVVGRANGISRKSAKLIAPRKDAPRPHSSSPGALAATKIPRGGKALSNLEVILGEDRRARKELTPKSKRQLLAESTQGTMDAAETLRTFMTSERLTPVVDPGDLIVGESLFTEMVMGSKTVKRLDFGSPRPGTSLDSFEGKKSVSLSNSSRRRYESAAISRTLYQADWPFGLSPVYYSGTPNADTPISMHARFDLALAATHKDEQIGNFSLPDSLAVSNNAERSSFKKDQAHDIPIKQLSSAGTPTPSVGVETYDSPDLSVRQPNFSLEGIEGATATPSKGSMEESEEEILRLLHFRRTEIIDGVPISTSTSKGNRPVEEASGILESGISKDEGGVYSKTSEDEPSPLVATIRGIPVRIKIKVTPRNPTMSVSEVDGGVVRLRRRRKCFKAGHSSKKVVVDHNNMNVGVKPANMAKFPKILCAIVSNPKNDRIIKWDYELRAVVIVDEKQFVETIMPKYFKRISSCQDPIKSFLRQLNYYGFQCVVMAATTRKGAKFRYFVNRDKSIAKPQDIKRVLRYVPRTHPTVTGKVASVPSSFKRTRKRKSKAQPKKKSSKAKCQPA